MTSGKIYILIDIITFISIISFLVFSFNYINITIYLLSVIVKLSMYKVRRKMYDNSKTNYKKKSYKNIVYNVFMSEEEKKLKEKTDWVLDLEKIREKYTYENLDPK